MNRKDKKQHTVKKKIIIINPALTFTFPRGNIAVIKKCSFIIGKRKTTKPSLLRFRLPTALNTLILAVITVRKNNVDKLFLMVKHYEIEKNANDIASLL